MINQYKNQQLSNKGTSPLWEVRWLRPQLVRGGRRLAAWKRDESLFIATITTTTFDTFGTRRAERRAAPRVELDHSMDWDGLSGLAG